MVLAGEGSAEHRRVVRVERDHHSGIDVLLQRVLLDGCATSRPHVAAQANLDRDLLLRHAPHQLPILHRAQAVSDALRPEHIEAGHDRFRPRRFAGMRRQSQAVLLGARKAVAKPLRRAAPLVAPDSNSHDVAFAELNRFVHHAFHRFGAEVPHRIENPEQGSAEFALAPLPPAFQALENRIEIESSPQRHAHRYVHLGVQHVFRRQPLH